MTSKHVIQNYAQAVLCCVNTSSGSKGLNMQVACCLFCVFIVGYTFSLFQDGILRICEQEHPCSVLLRSQEMNQNCSTFGGRGILLLKYLLAANGRVSPIEAVEHYHCKTWLNTVVGRFIQLSMHKGVICRYAPAILKLRSRSMIGTSFLWEPVPVSARRLS